MEASLNLDIPGKISELDLLLKKVLPKNVVWTSVLSKGLEFDGYRDYSEIDDSLNIDWKASKRASKILVKKYLEEKDRSFLFFIDVSENMVFGSTEKLKCEYAAEISAALAHRILNEGDKVGFLFYNNKLVSFDISKPGKRQFEIFVDKLSNPFIYGGGSNLNEILEDFLPKIDNTTSLIFLISDFSTVDYSYKNNFELLGKSFETIALIIKDPLDKTLPEIDKEIVIENPQNGERLLINPKLAKNSYEENAIKNLNELKNLFSECNIDFIELDTNQNSSLLIAEFLEERLKRRK